MCVLCVKKPIETSGAVFKNIDNAAKFLWSEIPSSLESFTVSYKLFPPSGHKVDFEIKGTFSAEFLISENENISIDIPATKFTYKKDELFMSLWVMGPLGRLWGVLGLLGPTWGTQRALQGGQVGPKWSPSGAKKGPSGAE